ncbi:MAG: GNAT family protein [Chloroflexota bacterium]
MALEGKLTLLREERKEDLPLLLELRNDLDTQGWSKTLPPDYTLPMYEKQFEGREFSFDRYDGRFVIEHKKSGQIAGNIRYYWLDPRMSVTIGIAVSKSFWGTGVAYDAQEILLHFLFIELGLRVVRLWTHSGNVHAIKLAERSGFQIAARRRQSIIKNGQLFDNIVMDLLREEYFANHPELTDELPPL